MAQKLQHNVDLPVLQLICFFKFFCFAFLVQIKQIYMHCLEKCSPFYILNNLDKNEPIAIIFGENFTLENCKPPTSPE